MWCMRRMRMVRISRPSLLLLWLEQQRIRTEAIDADTTIFVSIGARSGGIRSCGWLSRITRAAALPLVLRCQREQRRIRTEVADADTTIFVSISALVAAAFGPAVGSAACRVRSGDTRAACIRTRAAGAASGCTICSSSPWQSTAWQAQQDFAATADWRATRP